MNRKTGKPLAGAFELKGHEFLSVNWLEHFECDDITDAIDQVREVLKSKLTIKQKGRIIKLRVAEVKGVIYHYGSFTPKIELLCDDEDPSHCGIYGYTDSDVLVATQLARLVMQSDIFPGLLSSEI
ncbi:MAG: hypothetical protein OXF84_03630 [Bacteroidetes bacterium]|nr:hypothetical protein [Bacteroidota bacterium]